MSLSRRLDQTLQALDQKCGCAKPCVLKDGKCIRKGKDVDLYRKLLTSSFAELEAWNENICKACWDQKRKKCKKHCRATKALPENHMDCRSKTRQAVLLSEFLSENIGKTTNVVNEGGYNAYHSVEVFGTQVGHRRAREASSEFTEEARLSLFFASVDISPMVYVVKDKDGHNELFMKHYDYTFYTFLKSIKEANTEDELKKNNPFSTPYHRATFVWSLIHLLANVADLHYCHLDIKTSNMVVRMLDDDHADVRLIDWDPRCLFHPEDFHNWPLPTLDDDSQARFFMFAVMWVMMVSCSGLLKWGEDNIDRFIQQLKSVRLSMNENVYHILIALPEVLEILNHQFNLYFKEDFRQVFEDNVTLTRFKSAVVFGGQIIKYNNSFSSAATKEGKRLLVTEGTYEAESYKGLKVVKRCNGPTCLSYRSSKSHARP